MRIIIAGAGDVGFHLANLLSIEHFDIVLIDMDQEVLDYAGSHLDVLTIKGDCSSPSVLNQAKVKGADLFIAVTTSESTNLISSILGKKLGAKKTIARIDNREYLSHASQTLFESLGVDTILSPKTLAAQEIKKLVDMCSFSDHVEFENGKLLLVGLILRRNAPILDCPLQDIKFLQTNTHLRPIAILRGTETIIPRGNTILKKNDHVYFITQRFNVEKLETYLGQEKASIKNIMIIGGESLGAYTAKILESEFNVTLVVKSKKRALELAEYLNKTLIIHGDYSNTEMLIEEGLSDMDAFIALTSNSETNIITSLTAKKKGVFKTIAQVENSEYIHLSQEFGINSLINKKLIAAGEIFRFVRKGKVEVIANLHGVDAEIIEFIAPKNSKITKKEIKDLSFPRNAFIGGVIRGEGGIIPMGDFKINAEDKVIVFALPSAIPRLEKLFN